MQQTPSAFHFRANLLIWLATIGVVTTTTWGSSSWNYKPIFSSRNSINFRVRDDDQPTKLSTFFKRSHRQQKQPPNFLQPDFRGGSTSFDDANSLDSERNNLPEASGQRFSTSITPLSSTDLRGGGATRAIARVPVRDDFDSNERAESNELNDIQPSVDQNNGITRYIGSNDGNFTWDDSISSTSVSLSASNSSDLDMAPLLTSGGGGIKQLNESPVAETRQTKNQSFRPKSVAVIKRRNDDDVEDVESTNIISKTFRESGLFRFLQSKTVRNSHKKYAKRLKNRNHTNIRRKVMHAMFGLGFSFLNHLVPKKFFVPGMVVLSMSTLLMELLRYQPGFHWMNDALHKVLGSSLRKHEMDGKFTGSFYFFMGVTCTAACFPKDAATLGIAQLALADPSASYFGRATRHIYWSRIENGLGGIGRNKGILGFIGGALFCVPFNYRVLSLAKLVQKTATKGGVTILTKLPLPGGNQALLLASLALGVAGAFADLCVPTPALTLPKKVWGIGPLPPLHVDDNFVVPIFSAYACTKLFQFLEWTGTDNAFQFSSLLLL